MVVLLRYAQMDFVKSLCGLKLACWPIMAWERPRFLGQFQPILGLKIGREEWPMKGGGVAWSKLRYLWEKDKSYKWMDKEGKKASFSTLCHLKTLRESREGRMLYNLK